MTLGTELNTFIVGLNGGATIDTTLLNVLVNTAKTIIEEERPWMVLRKTDTSKTVTTANTWQSSIDLSTITLFSKFYGEFAIRLFDGNNRIEYYRQVPFDRRLEYKDVSGTFCFDENTKTLYLNGVVPFAGTLYINYITSTTEIDVTSASAIWTVFPSSYIPLLGFYAIGIHKGAIDYDSINREMLPSNQAVLITLKNAMEKWDNDRQLSAIDHNDPTEIGTYPYGSRVNRNDI